MTEEINADPIKVIQSRKGKVPIIELFGPTIQGEGIMTGTLSHFLRTGGCPLKCSWCDSMHAVDPVRVKANADWLKPEMIVSAIKVLPWAPYVTFTGGDPCMWEELGDVIMPLNMDDTRIAVETQGSMFAPWLPDVDVVTFSPKGPSSGNIVDQDNLIHWIKAYGVGRTFQLCIKVVVFDQEDFEYAVDLYNRIPTYLYDAFYFTAGTPLYDTKSPHFRADSVLRSMRRITNTVLKAAVDRHPVHFNHKVHIGSQLHVLLWPKEDQGV